jgi:hypothetical protein
MASSTGFEPVIIPCLLLNNNMNCQQCNTILSTKNQKVFCSKSCSAKFNNKKRIVTDAHKAKTRSTLISKHGKKFCVVCKTELLQKRYKKTCSDKCLKTLQKTFKPPKTPGGYRKGSGRGKHGWYDGIYFDSTWELAYFMYCKDHDIVISRCNEKYTYIDSCGIERAYYPDFRVRGKLTEIKGHHTQNVDLKIKSISEPIDILYGRDLQVIFDYIEHKTKLKIRELYKLYGDPMQN